MAERILQHHPGEDADTHEGGDCRHRHADAVGIDRTQRAEAGIGQPDDDAADRRQRRHLPQHADVEAHVFRRFRAGAVGQRDRYQRQRQRHGDDDEQLEAADADGRDGILGQRDGAQIDEAIDRQGPGTGRIGHLGVQPAFHHGEQSGKTDALDEAHQEPGGRIDEQQHQDRGGGSDGGERREGADMAGRPDQPGDIDAADGKTDIVAGADHADHRGRKAFLKRPQRDEGSLQAVATDQDAGGGKQGDERAQR